jgi:hypothetical protein
MSIIGFDEEEKRLKQRSSNRAQTSFKLPQGPYIFGDFCTLHLPGIEVLFLQLPKHFLRLQLCECLLKRPFMKLIVKTFFLDVF